MHLRRVQVSRIVLLGLIWVGLGCSLASAQSPLPSYTLSVGSPSGQILPQGAVPLTTTQLAVDKARTIDAFQGQIAEKLKANGVAPNGDSFGLVYQLNDVDSISQLQRKSTVSIPSFTASSGASTLWLTTDPKLKVNLADNVQTITYLQKSLSATGYNPATYAQFTEAAAQLTAVTKAATSSQVPTATSVLTKLNQEAALTAAIGAKIQASQALTPSDVLALRVIGADNDFRAKTLASAQPSGGNFGNGQVTVSVELHPNSGSEPVQGYRVRAVPPFFLDDPTVLPIPTSPASGSLPWATYCYFAVDPGTGLRVSDAVVLSGQSLYANPSQPIMLIFLGPQISPPPCTPSS